MKTGIFSCSKYRDGVRPGDDILINIPGAVVGVFDGASDPLGTCIIGEPAGRFAARNVAAACADLFGEIKARSLPAVDILAHLTSALSSATQKIECPIPPSTTLALMIDQGTDMRMFILGDSGIRINGKQVYQPGKIVDTVSICARVLIYRHLAEVSGENDGLEMRTRRIIFEGLARAVSEGILVEDDASAIILRTIESTHLQDHAVLVREFLLKGIQFQQTYANDPVHPLRFTAMNGYRPVGNEIIDMRIPKADLQTIEIFTDGYYSIPAQTGVSAWEEEHARVEAVDFHKTGDFAAVKGSTGEEFSDDRTILTLEGRFA
ncbi:MAG: hypothetical protein JKY49_16695 [Cohaesibacteraceae bacterium]|nr:hypothetical protein [Cohaesibacteraceae bacterium]MBL4875475.1 hypothetical protein [Cohaesibacteraceae bacterium]